jgi:hypothetical protein
VETDALEIDRLGSKGANGRTQARLLRDLGCVCLPSNRLETDGIRGQSGGQISTVSVG